MPSLKYRSILLFFVLFTWACSSAWAQCPGVTTPTYKTKNSAGSWGDSNDWAIGPPPYTVTGNTITIPVGQVVVIESSNFALPYSLIVNGTLILNGKLNMAAGTSITVNVGGVVCCSNTPCNAADRLSIGGNRVWEGTDGAVSGPAYSDGTWDLPVVLLFFKVDPAPEKVVLEWATASELNFDKFLIERTLDGDEFLEIGSIKGSGTSFTRKDYSFEDLYPIVGRSYYRLKAVDYDGTFEYFGLAVSNYAGPKAIIVHPNPSRGETVKLMMNFHPDEQSRIEIFNNLGIKLDQMSISEMNSDVKLPSGLTAGSYLIRFSSGSYSQVIRFSVL